MIVRLCARDRQTVRISAFEEIKKKCFLLFEAIGGYTKDTEWLPSDVSMVVNNNNLPCGGGKQSNIGMNIIFLNFCVYIFINLQCVSNSCFKQKISTSLFRLHCSGAEK